MDDPHSQHRLREQDLFWREVDGEIVVLDGRRWEYLQLNESGMRLWHKLAEGISTTEMADLLMKQYGIELERATADVAQFLQRLQSIDLLLAPSPASADSDA